MSNLGSARRTPRGHTRTLLNILTCMCNTRYRDTATPPLGREVIRCRGLQPRAWHPFSGPLSAASTGELKPDCFAIARAV